MIRRLFSSVILTLAVVTCQPGRSSAQWHRANGFGGRVGSIATAKWNGQFAESDGRILRREPGGLWSEVIKAPSNAEVVASSGTTVYVGTRTGQVRICVFGDRWYAGGTGLPMTYVESILRLGSRLLAGTSDSGVYMSRGIDSPEPWTPSNRGIEAKAVFALIAQNGSVFAGTNTGIYRSTDSGTTWSPANSGISATYITSLASDGNVLYASADIGLRTERRLYRSTNSGASWQPIGYGLVDTVIYALLCRKNSVYAATDSGIYRSTDSGATWQYSGFARQPTYSLANDDSGVYAGHATGVMFMADGQRYWQATFGDETGSLVVASIKRYQGWLYAAGDRDNIHGVFRSTDHGATWNPYGTVPRAKESGYGISDVAIDSNYCYLATTGGVYVSSDFGKTYQHVANGLPYKVWNNPSQVDSHATRITVCRHTVYVGGQTWGVWRSTDHGQNWGGILSADWISTLRTDNDSEVYVAGGSDGVNFTTNYGDHWYYGVPDHNETEAFAGTDEVLYVAKTGADIFRSLDRGVTWSLIAHIPQPSEKFDDDLGLVAFGDTVLVAGQLTNQFYASTDRGVTWLYAKDGLTGWIEKMARDGRKIILGGGGIWYSTIEEIFTKLKPLAVRPEEDSETSLQLYPNPTVEALFVSTPHAGTISVVDQLGRRVKRAAKLTGNALSMSCRELPAGLYHLTFDDGKRVQVRSFTVVK